MENLNKNNFFFVFRSKKQTLKKSPLSTGVVYSRLQERGYQMLCLCSCSSWGWACQGLKHVEDSNVTYMFILKCALKLVEEIIIYYDARSKKHQIWKKNFDKVIKKYGYKMYLCLRTHLFMCLKNNGHSFQLCPYKW